MANINTKLIEGAGLVGKTKGTRGIAFIQGLSKGLQPGIEMMDSIFANNRKISAEWQTRFDNKMAEFNAANVDGSELSLDLNGVNEQNILSESLLERRTLAANLAREITAPSSGGYGLGAVEKSEKTDQLNQVFASIKNTADDLNTYQTRFDEYSKMFNDHLMSKNYQNSENHKHWTNIIDGTYTKSYSSTGNLQFETSDGTILGLKDLEAPVATQDALGNQIRDIGYKTHFANGILLDDGEAYGKGIKDGINNTIGNLRTTQGNGAVNSLAYDVYDINKDLVKTEITKLATELQINPADITEGSGSFDQNLLDELTQEATDIVLVDTIFKEYAALAKQGKKAKDTDTDTDTKPTEGALKARSVVKQIENKDKDIQVGTNTRLVATTDKQNRIQYYTLEKYDSAADTFVSTNQHYESSQVADMLGALNLPDYEFSDRTGLSDETFADGTPKSYTKQLQLFKENNRKGLITYKWNNKEITIDQLEDLFLAQTEGYKYDLKTMTPKPNEPAPVFNTEPNLLLFMSEAMKNGFLTSNKQQNK